MNLNEENVNYKSLRQQDCYQLKTAEKKQKTIIDFSVKPIPVVFKAKFLSWNKEILR